MMYEEKNANIEQEIDEEAGLKKAFSRISNSLSADEMFKRYRESHNAQESDNQDTEDDATQNTAEKKSFFRSATDAAKAAGRKVVNAFDQNDDGKLDFQDIKDRVSKNEEKRAAEKKEKEMKALLPVFPDDISSPEFALPKMIHIAEMDKKHAESELCKGSVGHETVVDGLRMLNIYPANVNLFDIHLVPNADSEVYYIDPFDRDKYIALDEYFKYLRLLKVHELQRIAQDLGAKHFRVTYISQEKENSNNDRTTKIQAAEKGKPGQNGSIGIQSDSINDRSNLKRLEVMAEMEYMGHEPKMPKLFYLKSDPNVESLIEARMSDNTILHQKLRINLLTSSGIKEKDAVKIDAALSAAGVKLGGGVKNTITSQTQNEAKMSLEYEIDF